MADEEDHREFLLSALRGGVLKAKLFEVELNSVGVALKSGMITPLQAMRWLKAIGAEWFVGMVPDEMMPLETGLNEVTDARNESRSNRAKEPEAKREAPRQAPAVQTGDQQNQRRVSTPTSETAV